MEGHQDQPGTPGVDPATADVPTPAPTGPEASPSTVPTGAEHEAAPANDPGQDPALRSPAAVATVAPSAAAGTTDEDDGYSSARPLLMIGAAGDDVAELGWLLAGHGFDNAISQGQAAAPPILDDALMRVVVDFQQQNGIDPWKAEGDGPNAPVLTNAHLGVVDARTWEALLGYQHKVTPTGKAVEGQAV